VALGATLHEVFACLSVCLAVAALLCAFAHSGTPAAVRFTQTLLADFLAFPDTAAFSAIAYAAPAFEFKSLKRLSSDELDRILTIVIGGVKTDSQRALCFF
jgi:hypothetical protein